MIDFNIMETTDLYDKFWIFAYERQKVFVKRLKEEKPPWTNDAIILKYKFTNTYRFLDRVSQYLIINIINSAKKYTNEDLFFRILLFKIFNKIETWEQLEKNFGDIKFSKYSFDAYDRVLLDLLEKGDCIYSAAYIMPSGTTSYGHTKKHQNNLRLIEQIMSDKPVEQLEKMTSLQDLYDFFLKFPTIGSFLAYQFAIDINYSDLCNFSEMDFIVAGPGAIRGIKKCFKGAEKKDYSKIITYVTLNQDREFAKRNIKFDYVNNRKLQLVDIQNIFCEIDKYSRQYSEYNSNNSRIKQKYKHQSRIVTNVMPVKWTKGV